MDTCLCLACSLPGFLEGTAIWSDSISDRIGNFHFGHASIQWDFSWLAVTGNGWVVYRNVDEKKEMCGINTAWSIMEAVWKGVFMSFSKGDAGLETVIWLFCKIVMIYLFMYSLERSGVFMDYHTLFEKKSGLSESLRGFHRKLWPGFIKALM